MASPLSPTDRDRLAVLCDIIRDGLEGFIAVGNALTEIREKKLWRGRAGTFEDFVIAEFGVSKSYASRQIAAAETVRLLTAGPDVRQHVGFRTQGLVIAPHGEMPVAQGFLAGGQGPPFRTPLRQSTVEHGDRVGAEHPQHVQARAALRIALSS